MPQQDPAILAPWRHWLWLALLVAASVGFSLGFACATPFAAFAAAAALTLKRRDALLLAAAVWLANQVVGFGFLAYPWTAETLAWGVALGAATVLAAMAARATALGLSQLGRLEAALAAFLAAFAVYEGTLLAVALALLGGTDAFSPEIVGRIFAINGAAFAGLLVLNRLARVVGLAAGPDLPLLATERHA